MSATRLELKSYLENLEKLIDNGTIVTETNDLEAHVLLPAFLVGTAHYPTLLHLLGYTRQEIEDHPTKGQNGTVRTIPDYVMRVGEDAVAVLELKAPNANLTSSRFAQQVLSYCQVVNAPLGLLFNGTSLRIFLNTNYRGFARQRDNFSSDPVLSVQSGNTDELVEAFLKLCRPDSVKRAVEVGRRMARLQQSHLNSLQRKAEIKSILDNCLKNPPDEFFEALAGMNDTWSSLNPAPDSTEIKNAWP